MRKILLDRNYRKRKITREAIKNGPKSTQQWYQLLLEPVDSPATHATFLSLKKNKTWVECPKTKQGSALFLPAHSYLACLWAEPAEVHLRRYHVNQVKCHKRRSPPVRQVGKSLFPETMAHSPATTSWASLRRAIVKKLTLQPMPAGLTSGAVISDTGSRGWRAGRTDTTAPTPHPHTMLLNGWTSVPQEEDYDPCYRNSALETTALPPSR